MSAPTTDEALIAAALAARDHAYAPYSHYQVGCAVLAGGDVFTGANIENASYGLAMCAERVAVAQAVLAGHRVVDTVVVATSSSPPATPCGLCRQTLNEFLRPGGDMRVLVVNPRGEKREYAFTELFPAGFTGDQM